MRLDRWWSTLPLKCRALFRHERVEDELDEEVRYHLDRKAEMYVAQGLSSEEARLAARRDFGGVEPRKEDCRDARGWVLWVEQTWQDTQYALRTFWRAPGFAFVAIVTLALGIGANAAIFTLLDGVMLKPLHVADPDELVLLQRVDEQGPDPQLGIGPKARFSYPAFQRFAGALPPATAVVAMSRVALFHARVGQHGRVRGTNGQLVSGAYFSALRVTAPLGRLLDESDNRQIDAHPVAVLSHRLWQELGAPADVIGQPMVVNGVPLTVVGVAQRGFRGVWADLGTDLWLPLSMQHAIRYRQQFSVSTEGRFDAPWLPQDGVSWLTVIARVPADQQEAFAAATDAVHRNDLLAQAGELRVPAERVTVALQRRRLLRTPFEQGLSTLRPQFASPLYLLMGLVGLVLAVACVNVASLLLARGFARTREIGLRLSLGATRLRLVREMVVESLALSLLGGAVGVLMGAWLSRGLAALALVEPLPVDTRVLVFSLVLSAVTAILFATAPIIGATRVDPARMTAIASKGTLSTSGVTRMRPLVVVQTALTFVVVAGAIVFGRSLAALASVNPGFERQRLVALSFDPSASGYDLKEGSALQRRLLERATAAPGVVSAAVSSCVLAAGCRNSQTVRFEEYTPAPEERVQVQVWDVGANYFATTGMDIIDGRPIEPRDVATGAGVAVINASVAQRYFSGRSPIGKRFGRGPIGPLRFEIVGVVSDARTNDLTEAPVPTVFVPFPGAAPGPWVLQARVNGDPERAVRDLQASISRFEPGLLIERATTIESQLQRNLTHQRLVAYLTSAFGGLVLVLACVGVYGVMAYGVTRRTHEIGIQIALGARPGDLMREVLTEGMLVAGIGIALGAVAAVWATRYVGTMLYGMSPRAPMPYVVAMTLLLAAVLLACLVPARRAAYADPAHALRSE
jgi:predicted permease